MADSVAPTAEDADHAVRICDAMTSIVMCGLDNSRRTGSAFVDTNFDEISVTDHGHEDSAEVNEDSIASDKRGPEIDTDNPI